MPRLLAGLVVLLCCPALLIAAVPVPREKPVHTVSGTASLPLPRVKPVIQARGTPAPAELPTPSSTRKPRWPASSGKWPAAETAAARAQCETLLAGLDMIWRPDSPIGEPGGCGTPAPIAVSEIADVRINPPATVSCPFAAALHGWIDRSLQPAARQELRSRVTEIRNAAAYDCRRRNNASIGKLSEHAKANALDVSSFVFEKRAEVTVAGSWSGVLQSLGISSRGNFLRKVRKESCAYFNTVLGPGSDSFHKDHFHVDLMPLRPGRFKMCR
jgi:hypothetical protein